MVDGLSTSAPVESQSRDPQRSVQRRRPRLLVSVRSAAEAAAALGGGAHIIDVKEPNRGPLGMAEVRIIADIVECIHGRNPVSAALGEAADWLCCTGATGSASAIPELPGGLSFAKLGLAGLGRSTDWVVNWLAVRAKFERAAGRTLPWVAVAYADADAADAPPVSEIIEAAAATGCRGVLIDTFDKAGRGVMDLPAQRDLDTWREQIQSAGMFCALAGRLKTADLRRRRVRLFDIVGVRSAACDNENRSQQISLRQVTQLSRRLSRPETGHAARVRAAARFIRSRWQRRPAAAVILGTGMSGMADAIDVECTLDVRDVPYFRPTTAPGHRGRIVCGLWRGVPVIALDGRCHRYEGCTERRVAFPVRVMRRLGARVLIATNAAGGLNPGFRVGDVMVVDNDIDLMSPNGLSLMVDRLSMLPVGCDAQRSATNDSRLADAARAAACGAGFTAHSGRYVGVIGPNYETRAEYRLFRAIGGDAVGMSTIPEIRAAAKIGMRTLAMSVITNVANPDALEPADAESVIHAAESAKAKVSAIIDGVIEALPRG